MGLVASKGVINKGQQMSPSAGGRTNQIGGNGVLVMALLQVSLCGSGPVDNLPGQAETQLISAGDQVLQVLCLMRLTLPRIFIPGWDI